MPASEETLERCPLILVGTEERPVGLVVDEVVDEQDVVIKPLGPLLARVPLVAGGAILASGEVTIVLDLAAILAGLAGLKALPREAAPSAGEVNAPARSRTILVAEDVLTTRELMRSILEAAGYVVEAVVDGAEALARLSQRSFDALVTDAEMPRVDGFELTAQVRRSSAHHALPIIVVTALARDEDRRRGLEAGANAYITKGSFDQTNLLETLRRLLG
ncbi:MAG: response regulator [Chloroflexi bacterium]|nr:response regulator [Chloroflexota bacterium]